MNSRPGQQTPPSPSDGNLVVEGKGAGAGPLRGHPAPAPGEPSPVGIYRLTREWSTFAWLCARHLAARLDERWTAERTGDVLGFGCDDCESAEQGGSASRFFINTGGRDAGELIERAAQHGAVRTAKAYAAPGPHGCYGCVEVAP